MGRGDEAASKSAIPPRRNPFRQEIKTIDPRLKKEVQARKQKRRAKEKRKEEALKREASKPKAKDLVDVFTNFEKQSVKRKSKARKASRDKLNWSRGDLDYMVGRKIKTIELLDDNTVDIYLSDGNIFNLAGYKYITEWLHFANPTGAKPKRERVITPIPGYDPKDEDLNWGYPKYFDEANKHPLIRGQRIVRAQVKRSYPPGPIKSEGVVLDFEEGERMEIYFNNKIIKIGTPKEPPASWQPRGNALRALEVLEKKGAMSAEEVAQEIGTSKASVYQPLRKLRDSGRIKKEGQKYRKA